MPYSKCSVSRLFQPYDGGITEFIPIKSLPATGSSAPEVVQGTTEFHHQIADAFFTQADAVFDDATTLDTAVDMLDAQPTVMQRLVGHMLLPCQLLTAGFLRRHQDLG